MKNHVLNREIAMTLTGCVFVETVDGEFHIYKGLIHPETYLPCSVNGDEVRYVDDMGQLLTDLADSAFSDFLLKIEPPDSDGDWYVKLVNETADEFEMYGEEINHTFAVAVAKFLGVYHEETE